MDVKVELPTADKPKLAVRNLNFYYGAFHALKNINLDIPQNKVTAFIGPSGCGKSTLLRTFNRMFELYPEQRAEGSIVLDGEDILKSKEDVSLIRAKVGMVFQKPTPFPMSIYDNIAFGALLGVELEHAVENAQQRRLAAAGRANKSRYLVFRNFQVDVLQRMELAVKKIKIFDRNFGHFLRRNSSVHVDLIW